MDQTLTISDTLPRLEFKSQVFECLIIFFYVLLLTRFMKSKSCREKYIVCTWNIKKKDNQARFHTHGNIRSVNPDI